MMRKILLWAPLMVFALFLGVFLRGLHAPENTTITSKMVGKVVLDFVLPAAVASHPVLTNDDRKQGQTTTVSYTPLTLPTKREIKRISATLM